MDTFNAIIETARLELENPGCLVAWLQLEHEHGSQAFGGHVLYTTDNQLKINFAGWYISRIMEVAGIDSWAQLPGKAIRVRGSESKLTAIGHIVKDDWFTPEDQKEHMLV
jgi:hypothetical protein